jgi:hypothetical protein
MNYHGVRYLEVGQFASYCKELKVDVEPFHHDLELYEKERVIYPAARVIKPKCRPLGHRGQTVNLNNRNNL